MTENNASQGADRIPGASGIAKGISAGLSGEEVSTRGILNAVGGARGIVEALLPGLMYLTTFVFTQDPYLSVIAPSVIAVIAFIARLAQKQTLVTALSGLLGIAISVVTTVVTGRGEDYFLPGFWINGAWTLALIVSLIVGWPLIGFIVGALRGDPTGWRRDRALKRAATVTSWIWLGMFVLRLAVQLPLYAIGDVTGLGIMRLVMGTPLFTLVILATWLIFRNIPTSVKHIQG